MTIADNPQRGRFGIRHMLAPALSLFTSGATLICCALPALMVSLGMGAALAGLTTNLPQLIWLSQHKGPLFSIAALLIVLAGIMMVRARRLPCPTDPQQARTCTRLRRISWGIYGFSVLCFTAGFFFAFIAPYLMEK